MSSKIVPGRGRGIEQYTWRAFIPDLHGNSEGGGPLSGPGMDAQLSMLAAEADRQMGEAFERGRKEGRAEGERAMMTQLDPVISRLSKTIAEVASSGSGLRRQAEEDVVKLSVAIARRILNRELSIDPDAIMGLVKSALGKIEAREIHRVLANPEDAPRITRALDSLSLVEKIKVSADSALERGAVLFETSRGVLDASVGTQLDEIERGLTDRIRGRG